jgi:AcrR family transcriptional regulator
MAQPLTISDRAPTRRLRRTERRDQILVAATRAFARSGFAATSLDDIAAEAHISRVILYRHFDSKTDLYRAVLDRVCARLVAGVGTDGYGPDTLDALLQVAAEEPAGFRLLFQHAAREPEFKADVDRLRGAAVDIAHRHLADQIPERAWAQWSAQLAPTVAVDAVIAWLDAGQPDRDHAAGRILHVLGAIVDAAKQPGTQLGSSATAPAR